MLVLHGSFERCLYMCTAPPYTARAVHAPQMNCKWTRKKGKELLAVNNCLNGLLDKHFETSRWYSLFLLPSFLCFLLYLASTLFPLLSSSYDVNFVRGITYIYERCINMFFFVFRFVVRSLIQRPLFDSVYIHRWFKKMEKYVAWVVYAVYGEQSHIMFLIISFFVMLDCPAPSTTHTFIIENAKSRTEKRHIHTFIHYSFPSNDNRMHCEKHWNSKKKILWLLLSARIDYMRKMVYWATA